MDSNNTFAIGYGAWAKIDFKESKTNYHNGTSMESKGKLLQVTNASISRTRNIPTVNSYYLPYLSSDGATSPIRLGDGTYTFTGELSFQMTKGVVDNLFKSDLFSRNSWFSLSLYDGRKEIGISNCVWSGININCAPGGTVTMSISYSSNNGYHTDFMISKNVSSISYDDNDFLIPYWQCGHENFLDFSISFSRNVTPVFLNNDLYVPSYLRPGLAEISLNATTLTYISSWGSEIDVKIGKSHGIKLLKAALQSCQYNMSSMNDVGAITYTWNSIGTSATTSIFSIY